MQNARALLPQALILFFCGIPRPPPCVLCAIHLSQRTDFSPFTSSRELRAFSSTHTAMQGTPRERKNGFEGLQRNLFFAIGEALGGCESCFSHRCHWRGCGAEAGLTCGGACTSRSGGLPSSGTPRRSCTARRTPRAPGTPAREKHSLSVSVGTAGRWNQEHKLTFSACAEGCGAVVYGSRIKKTLYNSEIKPNGKTSLLLLLSDPLNWCTHNAFTKK